MKNVDFDCLEVIDGRNHDGVMFRDDLKEIDDMNLKSDLDRHLARLLTLHKGLCVKFRNQDLAGLNEQTKLMMLEDINELLGIEQC